MKKIISQIRMTDTDFGYKNIGKRMQNIGMKIESIRVDHVRKEDAESPIYTAGDQVITIFTNEPNAVVKSICPIAGNPKFIKRRGVYIPQNRTAYWLMHNKCEIPGR